MGQTTLEKYTYDENFVRFELVKKADQKSYNWVFLPGGPGCDSRFFKELIEILDLPGNVWLIDLPGNGDNVKNISDDYDYDNWIDIFVSTIKKFDNPILVGHSFGGMFPLLFPELENHLKGFVILHSAPSLWLEEAAKYAKNFDVPDLTYEMQELINNPNQETFDIALQACLPYYVKKETVPLLKEKIGEIPFHFRPAVWWQKKVIELNFSAKWIPQNVPTVIVGGKYDCICPFHLFKNDKRFNRPNIVFRYIEDAGHISWIENPKAIKTIFDEFLSRISK